MASRKKFRRKHRKCGYGIKYWKADDPNGFRHFIRCTNKQNLAEILLKLKQDGWTCKAIGL